MRRQRSVAWLWVLAAVLAIGLLAVLTWANLRYGRENPGGYDFLVQWEGARSFLVEGISPYSDEATSRIQNKAYGRAAEPGEPQLRFVSPLYSIFIVLPFSLISDFLLARALWMTTLEAALLGLAFLTLRLARWRIGPGMLGLFLLFSVFWYHALQPLVLGNTVILVALGIAAALIAIQQGADEFAGILLGFTTIKPQVVLVLLVFVVIWAIGRQRWKIIAWLAMTVFLLAAVSALLMPNWIIENLQVIIGYASESPPGSPASAFAKIWPAMGARIGTGFSILVLVITLVEWWFNRRADFRGFLWAACMTLATSQWIGVPTSPVHFVAAFPGLVLVFQLWEERWHRTGRFLTLLSMVLLFAGIWFVAFRTSENLFPAVQNPILFLPYPAFLLISLYWVRWWAVKPPNLWADLLLQENR